MALSLDTLFELAQAAAKSTKVTIGNDDKLHIYANYKQATVGPCRASRPSAFRVADCYKYDAWKALGDATPDAAKEAYVAIMDRVDPSWRPAAASATPMTGELLLEEDGDDLELFHSILTEREPSPVEKLFGSAMAMVRAMPMVQFRDESRLQLYAFHQQAMKGPAPSNRPPANQVQACVKHGAWVAMGTLTKEECMAGYIAVVDKILPSWLKAKPPFLSDEKALYEVDVACAAGLGIKVSRDSRGLRVENVEETGAVGKWNKANPENPLAVGDLILAVNGHKVEEAEKPTAYQVNGRLCLHVRREERPEAAAPAPAAAPVRKEAKQPQRRGLCCCWSAQLEPIVAGAKE